MTEPILPTIRQSLVNITQRLDTINGALLRIVPDDLPVGSSLFELLRDGLFLAIGGGEGSPPTYRSLPLVMGDLLRSNPDGVSAANILAAIDVSLAQIDTNANLTRVATQALNTFLQAQLGPGTLTLNIPEQLNAIRENTAVPTEMGDVLDALNTLALQQRTLVSTDNGGLQSFTTAELLYGLALCSCAEFPPTPLDPPPAAFPTCLELTSGQNQQRFRFGPAVALSNVVFSSATYEAYVHPLQDTYVYPAQGQSLTPIPGTNGNGFFYTRDGSLTWTGAASSFGWAEPGTSSPSFFIACRWPAATPFLTPTQVQAMIDTRLGSINLKSVGRCLAGQFVAVDADPDLPNNWRAVVTLWLPGQGPSSQPASQYLYGRVNPPPGI